MQTPKILYEDDNLIVCYKPAGVATQTKRLGQQDMESILKNYVASGLQKQGKNAAPYIGIVHRLDQPVEGIRRPLLHSRSRCRSAPSVRIIMHWCSFRKERRSRRQTDLHRKEPEKIS